MGWLILIGLLLAALAIGICFLDWYLIKSFFDHE